MKIIKEFLKQQQKDYIDIIKRYTATIVISIITCIFYVILEVADIEHTKTITDIFVFLSVTALGFFFTETIVKGKQLAHLLYLFYVLALADGALWTIVYHVFSDTENEKLAYYIVSLFGLYLLIMSGWIFLEIVKDSGLSFEQYAVRLLFTSVKMCAVLLVFNLGFLIIVWLVNSLLMEIRRWEWLENIEVLLTGFVYVPFGLICLTGKAEEKSKFVRGLVLYVMMPLFLAAMAIVYIYALKNVVTLKLPSNEVFAICAGLFCCGVCVWTFAYAYTRDEETRYAKLVKNVKYIYVPLLILEAVALFMRIGEYGFTVDRYMGLWFMIAQVIYIFWEPIVNVLRGLFKKEKIGRNEHYEWYVFAVLFMYVLVILVPPTQALHVEYKAQRARFEKAYVPGNTDSLAAALGSYRVLSRNFYGKDYLENHYDAEALADSMNEIQPYGDYYNWEYVNYGKYNFDGTLDIAGYSTITNVKYNQAYNHPMKVADYAQAEVVAGGEEITLDLSSLVEYYMEEDKAGRLEDRSSEAVPYDIVFGDGKRLVVYNVDFRYNKTNDEVENLSLQGYLLGR